MLATDLIKHRTDEYNSSPIYTEATKHWGSQETRVVYVLNYLDSLAGVLNKSGALVYPTPQEAMSRAFEFANAFDGLLRIVLKQNPDLR